MVQMFIVSVTDWFCGNNNKTNMVIMTTYSALFCILLLQPCITGLQKMAIEQRKVKRGSLTNSSRDIPAFCKLVSAATLCHVTATALSWG